jgi:ribosomal protein S3
MYGAIGAKVWIYKGEVLPERRMTQEERKGRRGKPEAEAEVAESKPQVGE